MTYRDRREARADRLREWADKREDKAAGALARARQMGDGIPFGQPIMGARDRNYRDRIGATYDRGFAHAAKADAMRAKADNIDAAAARAIYDDDPDAIDALTAKLGRLEAERERIKAYNATCRKGAPDVSLLDARQLASLESQARHQAAYHARIKGQMAPYALSNLSGVISATRKRIAALGGAV